MTLTHDLALLCAAIDAGDDSALPILADALEEAGDCRAIGLRRALPWAAACLTSYVDRGRGRAAWKVIHPETGRLDLPWSDSRSAAYLALGGALHALGFPAASPPRQAGCL